jgi:proteasome lid subunit RPN8/RPN11
MTYLLMTEQQARALADYALATAPAEACGILAGRGRRLHQIIPVANFAEDPFTRYVLEPSALVKHLLVLENAGLSLLGFYHSHPNGDPIPSSTDICEATYSDAIYLIISLKKSQPELAAWTIFHDEVAPVQIHVGSHEPEIDETATLSRSQKTAIILSAIITVGLMLVVSIYLLPPAPALPVR